MLTAQTPPRAKPLLRGVSHEIAFFVSLATGAALVALAREAHAAALAAVFAASQSVLFGVSALYHRPMWSPPRRALLRRADHSAIFLLIAGSYTPPCALGIGGERGALLLWIVWAGATLGLSRALFWPHAPRWVSVLCYAALGWVGASSLPQLVAGMGLRAVGLFVVAGVLYTIGAVIYAIKRPDPLPAVFGYHEIFHLLVIVASAVQYAVIAHLVW